MDKKSKVKSPLVSIITVCYNSANFIEQTIKSVVGQDFEGYEYIIIDGGSTDGTMDIIEKYQHQLAYYHSKSDDGIVDAFNQGLSKVKGKWVVFLNSDDQYCDNRVLSDMANFLKANESVDLIYGQVQIIKRENETIPVSGKVGGEWRWADFKYRSTIPHPVSFTNKRFFEQYGAFDVKYRNALDYELYLRAGQNLTVVYVPRLVAWMRDGGMSKEDAYRSFRESRCAQIQHKVFNPVSAWVIYMGYAIRIFLKKFLTKL